MVLMDLWAVDAVDDELTEALGGLEASDWLRAAAIVVGALLLSRLIRAVATRLIRGDEGRAAAGRLMGRALGAVVIAIGIVYALSSLDVRLGPLLGALGIGGLALAFAAQSILENLFSSVLIQARRPFRIGDQVRLGDGLEGRVEDINFRVVALKTFDGERVLVPSSQVIQNPITNVTALGPWRTSLAVGVAYGTDLAVAQRVLLAAARAVDGVLAAPEPEVWFEAFGESSLDLCIRFWHTPEMATRWRTRSAVGMAAVGALEQEGISIPFPQRTLHFPAAGDGGS